MDSALRRIDRASGFHIATMPLTVESPGRVARVGVKPLARRIEYLAHSESFILASLLRISSSILGVM